MPFGRIVGNPEFSAQRLGRLIRQNDWVELGKTTENRLKVRVVVGQAFSPAPGVSTFARSVVYPCGAGY